MCTGLVKNDASKIIGYRCVSTSNCKRHMLCRDIKEPKFWNENTIQALCRHD